MNLKEMIEKGAEIAHGQKELAKLLGQQPQVLTDAKAGRRGIPTYACVRLAQILGEDELRIIAASELITEKNPEKRAVWLPFILDVQRAAASLAVGFHLVAATTLACMSNDAKASAESQVDTFNVSSPALQPAPLTQNDAGILCVM